jgi:multidrug efflux pump
MKLSEVCIHRPVFSWVMTLILILVGLVGGSRLALQQYPTIERPYITIESTLSGASPEIVEAQVTRIIEDAVAGIEGIVSTQSTSSVEDSKVMLEFSPNRRTDDAANDIRDRLSKIKDRLPHEMNEPTLTKSRAEDKPIMTLALTSDTKDASELADYAHRELEKELESVSGVARVDIIGAGLYKMHLKLDPVKLAAYNITVTDVMQAIRQQNIEKPAGKLISNDREYLVTTVASLETPEEFNNLPISNKEGTLIRLRDIGQAEITAEDHRTRTRFNGKPGVSIGVVKQAAANPITVAREVKKMLPTLQDRLGEEMLLQVGSDRTQFIEQSISQVYSTIFEATLLVILVVFGFLRSARASMIPLVTIPVSLIGGLFLMYLLNFSINTLTLMAMVLAIGLVVDDAIVVLENVYRYIEKGMKPFQAAIQGVREISFAIVAMTLTLVAVYAPIALSSGTIGKFFTEFALTLAGAVLISGFAALTLSPMMCARMLGELHTVEVKEKNWWGLLKEKFRSDQWLNALEQLYEEKLQQYLAQPFKLILSGVILATLGGLTFIKLPKELFPKEDQGYIFIDGQANQSSTLDHTDKYVMRLDKILEGYPEVKRRVTQINNPTYDVSIQLIENRARSTEEIEKLLSKELKNIPGIEAKIDTSGSGGDRSNMVEFVVQGNKSYREVRELSRAVTLALYGTGFVEAVLSNVHGDSEDFIVTVQRDKAASLGIEPGAIGDTIDALVRGRKASTFKKENKLYDVLVEVIDRARQTPHDITNLFMKANDKNGTLVPLSELVEVTARSSPMEIIRYNRLRAVTHTVKLKPGYGLGYGVDQVRKVAKENLPSDARIEFTGETKRFLSESQNIYLIFGLAVLFIYLVMAAQFESWIDPFIIMLSVPLSLAGAVLTLALVSGGTLNVYSQIGLVTLIGLITKHGILMVDFANKLRETGKSKLEAIVDASRQRLRPILMTTFAMVLGAIPLAFATGAGAESRRQIGWVIVGGMSIGTLFTLFVLPAFYLFIARKIKQPAAALVQE